MLALDSCWVFYQMVLPDDPPLPTLPPHTPVGYESFTLPLSHTEPSVAFNPFLDWSKLKQIGDDILKCI